MMRRAADSALSEQQSQQFSATAVRMERKNAPQARRKSCNGLRLYGFCGDATAYTARTIQISPIFVLLGSPKLLRFAFLQGSTRIGITTDLLMYGHVCRPADARASLQTC